jgi:hypothetical protein
MLIYYIKLFLSYLFRARSWYFSGGGFILHASLLHTTALAMASAGLQDTYLSDKQLVYLIYLLHFIILARICYSRCYLLASFYCV